MQCPNPIRLKRKELDPVWIPCGVCVACKQRKGRDWFIRLKQDIQNVEGPSYFVTLTFRDELIHKFCKRNLQLYIKSLRNWINRGFPNEYGLNPIKFNLSDSFHYFAIGERGLIGNREHYHVMFLNVPFSHEDFDEIIHRTWQDGFSQVVQANEKTSCYITDYAVTKDDEKTEFHLYSKGLGDTYLVKDVVKWHKERLEYKLPDEGGLSYSMPRYYRDKIFTGKEKIEVIKKIEQLVEPDYFETAKKYDELKSRIKFKVEKRRKARELKLSKSMQKIIKNLNYEQSTIYNNFW